MAVSSRHGNIDVWERDNADTIKARKRDIADRGSDLAREIEFAGLAKRHRFAGIEEDANRQLALLFVELEEETLETTVEIPIEVAEVIAVNVSAIIRELDRLAASA